MNTTHFVIMNNMNTTNMINQMNMIHMMNRHNTTETVSNVTVTGVDVVVLIVGFILLIWGGVKFMEWLFEKTCMMKDPWGCIISIVGIFSYSGIGLLVLVLLMNLI